MGITEGDGDKAPAKFPPSTHPPKRSQEGGPERVREGVPGCGGGLFPSFALKRISWKIICSGEVGHPERVCIWG